MHKITDYEMTWMFFKLHELTENIVILIDIRGCRCLDHYKLFSM